MSDRIETDKIIESSGNSLRLQLYVVTSTAKSLESVKQNLVEHRAYLRELEDRNILFGAGPLWTDDGQYFEGDGLLIYRADSVEAAQQIAQADPMHTSGARTFTIRPWLLNDGKITVQVTLSEPRRALI
ncbi:YciI family protein [Altericista sp. CCNU0014]|uniref:YciI family protein n=1 Tax=Altericista sp. CCNU0014 TaxID=3082949 RepID=UPI00384CD3D5